MSDALKVQLGEWAKANEVDLSNAEKEEISSIDMIHELQMEVKMLKAENAKLRKHSSRKVNKVASGDASASSANSQGSKAVLDDSDEVSHLSGMTSMSSCTKISAIGAFPSDFDDKSAISKGSSTSSKASIPPPPPPPTRINTKQSSSSRVPPRPSGRKVHIQETPKILTNDAETAAHEEFSVATSSPRSIMKKSTYSKGCRQSPHRVRSKRVQLQSSSLPDQDKTDVITHGFANFDQALMNGELGDCYSEV
jgi:FtsZ-binding cell division protein ZapB